MKLDEPKTIRLMIRICVLGLILLACVDFFFHHHEHFPHKDVHIDAWPFFYPIFGFVVCVAMVWVAKKVVGHVLMRSDQYYSEKKPESDAAKDATATDGQADHGHDGEAKP